MKQPGRNPNIKPLIITNILFSNFRFYCNIFRGVNSSPFKIKILQFLG